MWSVCMYVKFWGIRKSMDLGTSSDCGKRNRWGKRRCWYLSLYAAGENIPVSSINMESECQEGEMHGNMRTFVFYWLLLNKAIRRHIQGSLRQGASPSISTFIDEYLEVVVDHTRPGDDIERVWATRFSTVAKELKVTAVSIESSVVVWRVLIALQSDEDIVLTGKRFHLPSLRSKPESLALVPRIPQNPMQKPNQRSRHRQLEYPPKHLRQWVLDMHR